MFRICLLVALIAAALVLGPRLHERLQELVLVDIGTDTVHIGVWEILLAFAWIAGVLAAVVLFLALIVGFGGADLHGRFVLERQRERLRDSYPPADHGRPPQRRARRFTDQRNSARAVPASSARTE